MMNVRQLEAFRAVMMVGTATAAGELLRLSQPTVSKLIAQFERRSGLQLFERVKGRLVPRPEAVALFQHVDKLFAAMEEVGRNARQLANVQTGHLRLVAFAALALDFLPRAIASFVATRREVTVTLNVRASSYIAEWVAGQQADLGFVSGAPAGSGVVMEPFEPTDAVCVLPPAHPLAARDEIRAGDLEGERFISLGRDTALRHLIDSVFETAGVARRVVIETGYSATACALVASGAGVTVSDPLSALDRFDRGDVVLRRFVPHTPFAMQAVFPAATARSLLVNEFLLHLARQKRAADRRVEAALSRGL